MTSNLPIRPPKPPREGGADCIWPRGVELSYGISPPTRRRWEKDGRLPPRDFYVAGVAVGWHTSTIEAAQRGQSPNQAATAEPAATGRRKRAV